MGASPATTPADPRSRRPVRPDDGRLLRGRASRARIREASLALFREHGFDGATLRAIAARAGMGASSIYRHVTSKEELLIEELADRQEEAWTAFRKGDDRRQACRERLKRFLATQHALLAEDADLTKIALRATTRPELRVSRRVLALQDRTIGLVTEILLSGRVRGELARDVDVVAAARAILQLTQGARISWVNGLLDTHECARGIEASVELLFRGLAPASPAGAGRPV